MDKTAVLHWLQDIQAASMDGPINDSNGGSLNPNTTTRRNSTPLDEHHHNHPHNHHRSHYQRHQSLPHSNPLPPDSWHVHASPPIHSSSATLTPSSSFQVPEDPSKDEAPEVVKKFLRTSTLSIELAGHREPEGQAHRKLQETGIRRVARHGGSMDAVVPPSTLRERQAFTPPRLKHQNHSWSPLPVSNPELVQPTVELSREMISTPKRKVLLKTLSEVSISTPFSIDAGVCTSPSITTLKQPAASSLPKSAPVSPNLSLVRKVCSSPSNVEKSLSHSNLANLDSDEEISDISPSLRCGTGDKSSMDGQSNVANKGGFSDIASSDGGPKMPYDSRSSGSGQDDPVRGGGIKEQEKGKALEELMSGETTAIRDDEHGDKSVYEDLTGEVMESWNRAASPKPSTGSPVESSNSENAAEMESSVECSRGKIEGKESDSNEEELLKILKKWYKQGYGQKEDLARAMRLTGHRKSAHDLLMDEDLKDDCRQKHGNDVMLTAIQSSPQAKVETLPPLDTITDRPSVTSKSPDRCSAHSSGSLSPRFHAPVSPPSMPPPAQTTPPLTTRSKSPRNHLSSASPVSQPSAAPLPVTLLPLSRKKLAELDKVTFFSFDDSSDDILDGRSPSILAKNRGSPLYSKTHSWSLSDYSSSHTSSSSYSSHANSPSYKGRSPVASPRAPLGKHTGAETSEFHNLTSSIGPLRRGSGYSVFTVPEESRDDDRTLQLHRIDSHDDNKPPEVSAYSNRKFSLSKVSSLAQDTYSLPHQKIIYKEDTD